jgi:hypothetical protein
MSIYPVGLDESLFIHAESLPCGLEIDGISKHGLLIHEGDAVTFDEYLDRFLRQVHGFLETSADLLTSRSQHVSERDVDMRSYVNMIRNSFQVMRRKSYHVNEYARRLIEGIALYGSENLQDIVYEQVMCSQSCCIHFYKSLLVLKNEKKIKLNEVDFQIIVRCIDLLEYDKDFRDVQQAHCDLDSFSRLVNSFPALRVHHKNGTL